MQKRQQPTHVRPLLSNEHHHQQQTTTFPISPPLISAILNLHTQLTYKAFSRTINRKAKHNAHIHTQIAFLKTTKRFLDGLLLLLLLLVWRHFSAIIICLWLRNAAECPNKMDGRYKNVISAAVAGAIVVVVVLHPVWSRASRI